MSYLGRESKVSDANSTTTPLAAGATFTGEWEDVSNFPSVIIALKTDQNGTYTTQFSTDGVNVDSTLTGYYHTDHIEAPHRYTTTRKYARTTFTNTSASDQTYIRMQTMYCHQTDLNAPTDSVLAQHFDAQVVRPTDFHFEVALGLQQGKQTWNKFGYNDDLDIGTEVVADFGGTFTPLTTARTLSIVSTSGNDADAGTGAHGVVIYGIDANWEEQIEVVLLTGLTPVVTTSTWFGVNRIALYRSGNTLSNVGTITCTATTDLRIQAQIPPAQGTSQQLIFFTRANHQALADWMLLNAQKFAGGTSPIVTFKAWVFSQVSNSKYEVFRLEMDTGVENHIELGPAQPFVIGEKSAFWIEATTDKNDTSVSGRFSLMEFRDFDAGLSA